MNQIQKEVNDCFERNFGRTPLGQRIDDIFKEALELHRFSDMKNLKEEAGDLLASTIALCNENEWNFEELIIETLKKIEKRNLQYKSLGRKKQIAILGGSFSPVTLGHIALCKFILDTSNTFDEAWLCPCFSHMYNKNMASPEHRLKMCEIAAKVDGRIKVFNYEIINQLSGETFNFVKKLLNDPEYKDKYDFSYIIGMDNANSFDKWVNYRDLERMIRFVVVNRYGCPKKEDINWYLKPPHIHLVGDNIPNTSSTEARRLLNTWWKCNSCDSDYELYGTETQKSLSEQISGKVLQYVMENNLYKE